MTCKCSRDGDTSLAKKGTDLVFEIGQGYRYTPLEITSDAAFLETIAKPGSSDRLCDLGPFAVGILHILSEEGVDFLPQLKRRNHTNRDCAIHQVDLLQPSVI